MKAYLFIFTILAMSAIGCGNPVDNTEALNGLGTRVDTLAGVVDDNSKSQKDLESKIDSIPAEVIDICEVLKDRNKQEQDISTYSFNVGDRVIRRIDNANNKIAKVYDWNPNTRELLVTFEVDELAFIDGGLPSTLDAIVQFDGGVAASASNAYDPHQITFEANASIITLTDPISSIV